MTEIKPNHICKNQNCTNGIDGGRAHYYACDYCGKTQNWRSIACSKECYSEYMSQVVQSRAKNEPVNTYPERTDMAHDDVVELVQNTSIDVVRENTMVELTDYQEEIKENGLASTIDRINKKFCKK